MPQEVLPHLSVSFGRDTGHESIRRYLEQLIPNWNIQLCPLEIGMIIRYGLKAHQAAYLIMPTLYSPEDVQDLLAITKQTRAHIETSQPPRTKLIVQHPYELRRGEFRGHLPVAELFTSGVDAIFLDRFPGEQLQGALLYILAGTPFPASLKILTHP
jgi:hypothetical protein